MSNGGLKYHKTVTNQGLYEGVWLLELQLWQSGQNPPNPLADFAAVVLHDYSVISAQILHTSRHVTKSSLSLRDTIT